MTAPFGFPDFTRKASPGIDYLATMNVVTGGVQNLDITALVLPSHAGLLFSWVPAPVSAGSPIEVQVGASFTFAGLVPPLILNDGDTTIVPFPGAFITSLPGNTCTVIATLVPGDSAPLTGSLLIMGVNGSAITNPAIRRRLIGYGAGSGNVNCPAGATTTIVPSPLAGTYYQLKLASVRIAALPAAAARVAWVGTISGLSFLEHEVGPGGPVTYNVACEFETDFAISVTNNTTVAVIACAGYETWSC